MDYRILDILLPDAEGFLVPAYAEGYEASEAARFRVRLGDGVTGRAAVEREPVFVPDTMSVSDFLLEAQAKQVHCTAVVDEHGTAVGLAFREDALEEIVGPLGDEFDQKESDFQVVGDGAFEVRGRMSLPDLCDRLDFELGDDEYEDEDTIGGHVTARLGRLPRKGDAVSVGPFRATVLDAGRRRVQRVRLERVVEEAEKLEAG